MRFAKTTRTHWSAAVSHDKGMMRLRPLLLAALLLSVSGCGKSWDGSLRLRLKDGDRLIYSRTSDVNMAVSGLQTGEEHFTATERRVIVVDKVEGGEISVSASTQDAVVTQEQRPEGEKPLFNYDDLESGLAVSRAKMTITDRGQTLSSIIEGASSLDPIALSVASALTSSQKMIGPLGLIYPEGQVKVGQEWTVQIDLADAIDDATAGVVIPGSSELPLVHTVTAIEKRDGAQVVVISQTISGEVTISVSASGLTMDGTTTVSSTGEFVVEAATGKVLSSDLTSDHGTDLGVIKFSITSHIVEQLLE
jgi:hypothetical protein